MKLSVNQEDESKLRETFKAYRQACQYTVDYAWHNRNEENHIKTSKTCSYCGYVDSKNRRNKSDFECQECGREYHADYNAAKNIGLKFVRSGQKSQSGRANCQLALKSGSLKLREGEKPSTRNEFEVEITDKPLFSRRGS